MPEFNAGTELNYLEKDDILMSGSPTDFSRIKAQNLYNRTLTRAQLQALITANALNIGQQYTISNAVGNTFALKVTAVSTNVLDEIAVRVSNGENYIYDIVTDTATQSSNEIYFQITDPTETSVLSYDDNNNKWVNKEVNDILPQSIETDSNVEFASIVINGGNILDTYEQGTFTPTLRIAGGTTGITYSTQSGYYTRIGDEIFFYITIVLTSKGLLTGGISINDLPFVCNNNILPVASPIAINVQSLTGTLIATLISGSNAMFIQQSTATGFSTIQDTNITDSTEIRITGHYKV